jgi:adenylosuccinate synthase
MRYAVDVNGLDGIFLNKMDILAGLPEVKICVAYKHPTLGLLTEFPSNLDLLGEITPVYESLRGWTADFPKSGSFADLPREARLFVERIEKLIAIPVLKIGTGPGREDYLARK